MHIPVLQKEVIKYLNPKPNENFIDCAVGEGGHSAVILEKNGPEGKILGIEIDPELYKKLNAAEIKNQESRISNRLILVNDSYINLKEIIERENFNLISGILFDLGMSSWHLEESSRGFSFRKDEPLDMRYSFENQLTAEEIINRWPEKIISRILKEYGEERFSKRIAKEIIKEREKNPIKRTSHLVEIIKKATPYWYHHQKIHPATRTFQALRIAVNDELNNLKNVLPQILEVLEDKGRIVIISFHSLEDRLVKNFFRESQKNGRLQILTPKPISPSEEEIRTNPRSRSAKLRAATLIKVQS